MKIKNFAFMVLMVGFCRPLIAADVNLWTHRVMKTSKVWNAEVFGGNSIIGLIGTGMDTDHFQTINQVYTNFNEDPTNGIDDDGNGYVDDVHGWNFLNQSAHVSKGNGRSTEMMGVIASNHCAGPIRGMAPYAQIIPLQALQENGQDNDRIIEAMNYAAEMGAQVILFESPISLKSPVLQQAFQTMAEKNIMVVLPAGDQSQELKIGQPSVPTLNLNNMVVVGSTNALDQYSPFANYGGVVDLAAPGEKVWTTVGMENVEPIAEVSHSGIAAAHVAGALALLVSSEGHLSAPQLKQRLMKGVDHGDFPVFSRGRLNLAKLLNL